MAQRYQKFGQACVLVEYGYLPLQPGPDMSLGHTSLCCGVLRQRQNSRAVSQKKLIIILKWRSQSRWEARGIRIRKFYTYNQTV